VSVDLPPPAALLRHRGPALLLESIDAHEGGRLSCSTVARDDWTWPRMLEAAAQTAGLLAGLQPGGPAAGVVAQVRDVVVRRPAYAGRLRIDATLDRRVLQFWRCRATVRAADASVLLEGLVTLGTGPEDA